MIENGDADGVRRQAHTFKGAAATMSAEALRALCDEVQEAVSASDLNQALTVLHRLEKQFEMLKDTLMQLGWV